MAVCLLQVKGLAVIGCLCLWAYPATQLYCVVTVWDRTVRQIFVSLYRHLLQYLALSSCSGLSICMYPLLQVMVTIALQICKNYPWQTCSNVCGVVALVCAVLFALDKSLFKFFLCGPKYIPLFLHNPTLYERYLRRVTFLIHQSHNQHITIKILSNSDGPFICQHSCKWT